MAKKKTENIKAAPVLRAQGDGDDPTPTPEQTGTRTYQIMDPWKDRDVVNLVDVKSVDGEITDVKVNGQSAGGGGGVRTVQVSITNQLSASLEIVIPEYFFNEDTNQEFIIGKVEVVSRSSTNYFEVAMASTGAILKIITQFEDIECFDGVELDGDDLMVTGAGRAVVS